MFGDLVDQGAIRIEHPVHVAHVPGAETRIQDVDVAIEAVPAGQSCVVRDVTRALFEITRQPTPLEDLGENVGGLLAGEMHATQLSDRVVAVLEEDLLIELFGSLQADRRVHPEVARHIQVPHEFVEKEATQTLGASAIAREQRALHDLGQVHQREYRTVEIREITPKDLGLLGGEFLGGVDRHEMKR